MQMTPRRMAGVLAFSQAVRRHGLAEQINIVALGSRGERKAIQKAQRELMKE